MHNSPPTETIRQRRPSAISSEGRVETARAIAELSVLPVQPPSSHSNPPPSTLSSSLSPSNLSSSAIPPPQLQPSLQLDQTVQQDMPIINRAPRIPGSNNTNYRTFLPRRPNLQFKRGFRSSWQQKREESDPLLGRKAGEEGPKKKRRGMGSRLHSAWKSTPTRWYPIPIGLGALYLGAQQAKKKWDGDKGVVGIDGDNDEMAVKLRGPWQVHVMGALPLRSLSRLWGYLNSLELPVWSREPGFKLYSYVFGCNLDELDQPDLKSYASLGDFFYRRLRDGVRPIDDEPLVSPADGRLLHFGAINGAKVEQVKGLTYSLDALLGKTGGPGTPAAEDVEFDTNRAFDDHDFANINDIDYSLGDLLGSSQRKVDANSSIKDEQSSEDESSSMRSSSPSPSTPGSPNEDASVPQESTTDNLVRDASVALSMGTNVVPADASSPRSSVSKLREGNGLFFAVIYLAPGDYHRFHSPAAWVVERRRHFAGELFSVSPYIARRLSNLFVLNERVALLGRWRYGFFSMVPVGATNVGSIKINFDQALRTNERRPRSHPAGTYIEAGYSKASSLLRGQPLNAGEEMGGFRLGSTVVLVFEAPKDFTFKVQEGQKVKVGEALGYVPSDAKSK
ncbi:Phosphatidylserine decarboxylase [Phaffia rhodozyma]|uniref:Phosphatidylserine decarboxylase proenzyme 1, mitochondrial n=1 Tax=Phaffia rhodozyma TaxID=264483 RepID=A0A0F7SP98_PHARH|nr:Phosphatidylserine decarboxylase [Phaffia rhodozyma]